jgi:hypothetical protein
MKQSLMKVPGYIGSGQYCYANSLAMALSEKGDNYSPGYIECLTSGSISAFWEKDGLPFFSSYVNPPDVGLCVALKNLGYAYEHYYSDLKNPPEPKKLLQRLLKHGPVIAGPVDLGKLYYEPNHEYLGGVDHYVLVYDQDDEFIYLHDPAGYPYINFPINDFVTAWEASTIDYRLGSFSAWGKIQREYQPSEKEIFEMTDLQIRNNLQREKTLNSHVITGPEAIRKLGETLRKNEITPELKAHLTFFSFQLGARRCSDYSAFYQRFDDVRSEIKREQGKSFGNAHTSFSKGDLERVYTALMKIADLEQSFQERTLLR